MWMIKVWMVIRALSAVVLLVLAGLIILSAFGIDFGLNLWGTGGTR